MLAREGAKVIATDVNKSLLDDLKNEAVKENLDVTVEVLDVTDKQNIEKIAEKIDTVHVLFNCAGFVIAYFVIQCMIALTFRYVHQGSIFECSDDIFQRSFDINVRSMFWMVKIILKSKCNVIYP